MRYMLAAANPAAVGPNATIPGRFSLSAANLRLSTREPRLQALTISWPWRLEVSSPDSSILESVDLILQGVSTWDR